MSDGQRMKMELEKAFARDRDPSKWTIQQYDQISMLLDVALDHGLGEPRDKMGIGAATLVQAALSACTSFEKAQLKAQASQSLGPDDIRICNGKTVVCDECSRIIHGLNEMSQRSWNEAIIVPELNGPIFQNTRIETMAVDIRSKVILVRKAFRRIEGDVRRIEECLRMIGDVVSLYDKLEKRVDTEISSRERSEEDARNNMDRTKSQTSAAVAREFVLNKMPSIHDAGRMGRNDSSSSERKQTLMHTVAARATAIEMVDLQQILAEQMHYQVPPSVTEEGGEENSQTSRVKDDERFAQSLFGQEDEDDKPEEQQSNVVDIEITNDASNTLSKLRAKRTQRQLEKQIGTLKNMEAKELKNNQSTIESNGTQARRGHRRSANYKAKSDADKKRNEEMQKARAEVDEDIDDTEEEKMRRSDARKCLMKYDGDVWSATRTGRLDILQQFFLVESTSKLLGLHNKAPEEGRRTLLHTAAWWGQLEVADYLVRLGAEVDAIDTINSKTTPLIEAARAGHKDICKLLLDHGANITHQDAHGDTAIHWAARRQWNSLVVFLVRHGEKLNPRSTSRIFTIENYQGFTVLEISSSTYLGDLVKKNFGITAVMTRQQRRDAKRLGIQKLQRASIRMVMPNNPSPEDEPFENMVQAKAQVLDGLSKLGLGLETFAYTR